MITAKKSLGQNFLISPRIVDMIASAGEIEKGETIIEIGPGKGMLTKALLAAGAHVEAIEKDDRLIPILHNTFATEIKNGQLEIIHGDVLETEDKNIVADKKNNYKVIANIPYYITGQIIRTFLSKNTKPLIMVLMVQKEVADRIIARDGKESILSLSVKAYAKPELVVKVARGNFFPIPNVDSAVIKLSHIKSPFKDTKEEEKFFEIVKSGFAQKRKKLIKNLEAVTEKEILNSVFEKMNIDTNTRAEDMGLDQWIELTRTI